jgi:hypothetical protein
MDPKVTDYAAGSPAWRDAAEFDSWYAQEVQVTAADQPAGVVRVPRTTLREIAFAAFRQGLAVAREGRA